MIKICTFKDKEKEGGERRPQLGGQWKAPMLGGFWKKKEKHPFHLFSLSTPTNFTSTFFFPLILRFCFTMV
jgi:hypothetical protein